MGLSSLEGIVKAGLDNVLLFSDIFRLALPNIHLECRATEKTLPDLHGYTAGFPGLEAE